MDFKDALIYTIMIVIAVLAIGGALAVATSWITHAWHAGRNHCDHCMGAERVEGQSTTVYTSDR